MERQIDRHSQIDETFGVIGPVYRESEGYPVVGVHWVCVVHGNIKATTFKRRGKDSGEWYPLQGLWNISAAIDPLNRISTSNERCRKTW